MPGPVDTTIRSAKATSAAPAAPPASAVAAPTPPPLIHAKKPGPWFQFLSAKDFEWTVAELPVAHLPDELQDLRLLHLSDFHARARWDPAYDDLIRLVQRHPPDLILFTGDFVEHKFDYRPGFPTIKRLLDQLKTRLGCFAIPGNHDGALCRGPLAQLPVTMVDHRRLLLPVGGATLEIIGLGGITRREIDLPFIQSIGAKPPRSVRIVLSHFPDHLRRVAFLEPDLFLCGHTHGGQVCFPGRFPLLRHDSLPRRLFRGIHYTGGTWLVPNRGLGFSGIVPFRLFCPAEVIEIRLRKM